MKRKQMTFTQLLNVDELANGQTDGWTDKWIDVFRPWNTIEKGIKNESSMETDLYDNK